MYRVGLTGGIGAGKSAVAKIFAAKGATIIDADILARQAVLPGTATLAEIAARWPSVIRADGTLDRAALGAIVFADEEARTQLNALVHPAVRVLSAAAETAAGPAAIVVHDVPLLFEAGFAERCAATVVVIAPEADRIARIMARDGLAPEDIMRRFARQIAPEEACRRATYCIENNADFATLEERAADVYARILAAAQ